MFILDKVKALLNDTEIVFQEEVQSLWSGYGQIIRCINKNSGQHYIVKVVAPENASEHPRGWNTSISHERKIKSYQVEANFYQNYAHLANGSLVNQRIISLSRVPQLLASSSSNRFTLLVMEDLDAAGFCVRKDQADWSCLKIAIRWLAYFHARFMGSSSENLWEIGSYWHLATRQDEYRAMADSVYKTHAKDIDQALNNAKFQTLIHGDAKFENLCFHTNKQDVAAVDFQYVGSGSGVKDLAYLAGSCLKQDQLVQFDSLILNEYLKQLKQALIDNNNHLNFDALTAETQALYPLAWADFYRFLLGWNPQSWKVCDYMKYKSQLGLNNL